jgi:polyisoprenoid-binding protein YceI
VTVPAAELEVLTPPDTAERRKVRAAMQSDVLDVSRYPEIRLVSRTVQQVNDTTLHLVAALTIKDSTRLVPIAVRLAFAGDTLRAAAVFSIKQTDFGVRPYRGGPGGTVRVADKVTFDIHAVAIRR